jgi:hypothetical protein
MLVRNYTDEWLNFSIRMNEEYHSLQEQEFTLYHKAMFMNEDVELLQEGVSDGLKKFWTTLKKKIKELWEKFKLMVDRLVMSNKSWLEKYRGTILKRNLSDFEHEMHPYWNGANELQKTRIPVFNDVNQGFMDSLESEETFKDKWFSHLKKVGSDGEDGDFVEGLKDHFRGGEQETIAGSALTSRLPGIIDYCIKYNTIIQTLERDYKNIEKSVIKAEQTAAKAENTLKPTSTSENKVEPKTTETNTNKTPDANKSEGFSLENLLFLSEDAIDDEVKKKTLGQNTNEFKKNVNDTTKKTDEDKLSSVDNSSHEKASENLKRYRLYVTFCQKVLGAKQTVYEERYREYMKLLRTIAKGKAAEKGTDDESSDSAKERLKNLKAKYEKLSDKDKSAWDKIMAKRKNLMDQIVEFIKGKDESQYINASRYVSMKKKVATLDKQLDQFNSAS